MRIETLEKLAISFKNRLVEIGARCQLTLPFTPAADAVEIAVFSTGEGPTLVGAVELLSPGNKDRVASRNAFTSKCETYLQQGAGLVVVDVVTTLQANLHTELMNRLEMTPSRSVDPLYAVAYRVADHNGAMQLEVWEESLALGNPLPTLPLWLKGGLYMPNQQLRRKRTEYETATF